MTDVLGKCYRLCESRWLREALEETRSSVKFDLLHYEKMARAYRNIGREAEQTAATAEAEAQRLHELLAKIDALTNVGVRTTAPDGHNTEVSGG